MCCRGKEVAHVHFNEKSDGVPSRWRHRSRGIARLVEFDAHAVAALMARRSRKRKEQKVGGSGGGTD